MQIRYGNQQRLPGGQHAWSGTPYMFVAKESYTLSQLLVKDAVTGRGVMIGQNPNPEFAFRPPSLILRYYPKRERARIRSWRPVNILELLLLRGCSSSKRTSGRRAHQGDKMRGVSAPV